MPRKPDPAQLFPEVAAYGSLAAALQAVAAEQGISLETTSFEHDPLRGAEVASTAVGRGPLIVSAWHFERKWSVHAEGRGHGSRQTQFLIEGVTAELSDIPAVAVAWRDGTPLPDIERTAGFVSLTGRYEVPDDSEAHLIASEWGYVRTQAKGTGWPEYLALVEAAYARPELRRLYPYTSHWALRFSSRCSDRFWRPAEELTPIDWLCLDAPGAGRPYQVSAWLFGPVLAETATAEEAVSIVLRLAASQERLTIPLPPGRTMADVVDFMALALNSGTSVKDMPGPLTAEFGLSPGEAVLAVNRLCEGTASAIRDVPEDCPSGDKDPERS